METAPPKAKASFEAPEEERLTQKKQEELVNFM
jgi:hypothetical protein